MWSVGFLVREIIEDNLVQAGVRSRDWPARDSLLPFCSSYQRDDFSSRYRGKDLGDFQ